MVFAASQNNNENLSYFSSVSFSNGTLTSLGTNYTQGDGWTLRGYCWRLVANGAGTLSYSCRFLGTIWVVKTG